MPPTPLAAWAFGPYVQKLMKPLRNTLSINQFAYNFLKYSINLQSIHYESLL